MFNRKLLGQLFVLFLGTQSTYMKIDDKKLLRIVGGLNISHGKYPYVARLELLRFTAAKPRRAHICTCSILTPTWSLTASHCSLSLSKAPNFSLVIRYGSTLPLDEKGNYSNVLKFVPHPSFKFLGDTKNVYNLENDIALLKTDPVMLPKYGRVSAVDYMSLFGFKAVVAGFGRTNYTKLNKIFFASTLRLNMPLQSLNVLIKRCANDISVKVYPGICLARKCGQTVSVCAGDSGGPLIHNSQIIGVNSLAPLMDCSDKIEDRLKSRHVGIITAASPFTEWIGEVINENTVASSHTDGKIA
ncbi:trypsin-7-like [Hyposmocoma kahamanoa]|uniref:trypsin-7-like n=1 Tax=Hyposmocoma kahamanoa TaxID=1477025 RepID=UPI000E6D8D4C|nr:trypsin-7-like [Hyposmocoma kahamanoa]